MDRPGNYTLQMWQGATWHYELLWETGTPAAPVDLTDYSARMQVRAEIASDTTLLDLTSDLGGAITLGGAAGTIDLDLTATETADLTPGTHVYDLELESDTGTVTRLLQGSFVISPEVTR
jgi:hypothetical protein